MLKTGAASGPSGGQSAPGAREEMALPGGGLLRSGGRTGGCVADGDAGRLPVPPVASQLG